MKFIGKLLLYILIALLVVIAGLYFLLQTRWGAEHISAWVSENSDYHLAFGAMDHRFSAPSHIVLENVTFGRDGQPATLVAKSVDIALSSRQLTEPRHVDTILLENGTLNLTDQTAPLPFKADRLQLRDMAFNSPNSEWKLSAQRVNGGVVPWSPEAGKVLGTKAQIQFSENEVPNVIGRLVSNYEEVVGLKIPTLDIARIPQYLEANRLAAKGLDKPVFGGCIGPYSLAGRLFDMTEIMMAIYTEPETALLLLDKCTQFITQYCRAIKDCGSAGVIIAEPAAGLLSNEDCMQYSSVFVKRIVEEVQDSHFAVILHNCGNMGQCTQAMVATGAKGYHFGNKIDMLAALEECPSNALVMGNLDPVGIFKQATAEEVYRQTYTLLQKTTAYPNFVISTGCDVPPEIPLDNIRAFYEAVKDYNQKQ